MNTRSTLPKSIRSQPFAVASQAVTGRLQGLDQRHIGGLIAQGFDLALQLDRLGKIEQVIHVSEELLGKPVAQTIDQFSGQSLVDVMTSESRPKIVDLLRSAALEGGSRWRQINLITKDANNDATDFALSACAMKIEGSDHVMFYARDLTGSARLQQQLVDAQQRLEQEYTRLRHTETRYQAFFQMVSDALVVVEENTMRVLEANPAAIDLLSDAGSNRKAGARDRLLRGFTDYFDPLARNQLSGWLTGVGRNVDNAVLSIALRQGGPVVQLKVSQVRHLDGTAFLVTMSQVDARKSKPSKDNVPNAIVASVMDGLPDALVVTDPDGRILIANAAFVELTQLASSDTIVGESVSRWLSRAEVDVSVLLGTLKQQGAVRQYSTDIRGEFGSLVSVDISGVMRSVDGLACYGLAIRDVSRRAAAEAQSERFMPRSSDELKELVGRVPLKDIVGETADLIERLCIESALELTGDNRAAAAEMLGLSRQSLYVKLRRFGVGGDDANLVN